MNNVFGIDLPDDVSNKIYENVGYDPEILSDMSAEEARAVVSYITDRTKLRNLFMKLAKSADSASLLTRMELNGIELPGCTPVTDLFQVIRGEGHWDCVETRGNHVQDVYMKNQCNELARDAAVEFAIRVHQHRLTKQDERGIYNIYLYIQTHSRVFTPRVMHHVASIVDKHNLLTAKQKARVEKDSRSYGWGGNNDSDETDSESSEEDEPTYINYSD